MTISVYESTIENQFDFICKRAIEGEAKDYKKSIARRMQNEITFSDINNVEEYFTYDVYPSDFNIISLDNITVNIENDLLEQALKTLKKQKLRIILLYYFRDMNDTEISKYLNINRTTVYRHRIHGLELIKKHMEGRK